MAHVFVHKRFNNVPSENDIAVLVLNESLQFNAYGSAIKMPDPAWKLPGEALKTNLVIAVSGLNVTY